ncbi:MAG TPA: hypothetical protein DCP63_15370 [Bacteroidetes bacterium]|nr:hypothetical protein [Bacteroidota bacterium]
MFNVECRSGLNYLIIHHCAGRETRYLPADPMRDIGILTSCMSDNAGKLLLFTRSKKKYPTPNAQCRMSKSIIT